MIKVSILQQMCLSPTWEKFFCPFTGNIRFHAAGIRYYYTHAQRLLKPDVLSVLQGLVKHCQSKGSRELTIKAGEHAPLK